MNEKGYNGWVNWETWNAALHLDNSQADYEYWTERAQEILDATNAEDSVEDRKNDAAHKLSEELEAGFDEQAESLPSQCDWMADAINMYIREVDFVEIAEHYLSDLTTNV